MKKPLSKKRMKEKPKAKAGDFIEIYGDLCLVVDKGDWEMQLCKRDLAVVILKFADGEDWMKLACGLQGLFEKGDYKIIPKKEALRRLAE